MFSTHRSSLTPAKAIVSHATRYPGDFADECTCTQVRFEVIPPPPQQSTLAPLCDTGLGDIAMTLSDQHAPQEDIDTSTKCGLYVCIYGSQLLICATDGWTVYSIQQYPHYNMIYTNRQHYSRGKQYIQPLPWHSTGQPPIAQHSTAHSTVPTETNVRRG